MNLLPGRITGAGMVEIPGAGTLAFDAAAGGGDVGREVEVGIRPEDIEALDGNQEPGLAFQSELIEELGPNRLVHGLVGGEAIVMSVATSAGEAQSRPARIAVAPGKVHLFDKATGKSLRR